MTTTSLPPPDRYAVLGHPVAHSRSPFIHEAFARQTGQRLVYGKVDCGLDGFEAGLRAFVAGAVGDGPARGCNVTIPFKFDLLRLAGEASERALLAQAANTLLLDVPGWRADNTDGIGLVRDITVHAGVDLAGRRLLIVGAGGAGAGVLGPLIEQRPAAVTVLNRTVGRAHELVQRHLAWARRFGVELAAGGLEDEIEPAHVVINASASSLQGAAAPVRPTVLRPSALAVDLMYGAAARPFLDWAADHGAVGRDGLGMLVEQAAEAFAMWRGVRPDTAPVLKALREATG